MNVCVYYELYMYVCVCVYVCVFVCVCVCVRACVHDYSTEVKLLSGKIFVVRMENDYSQ